MVGPAARDSHLLIEKEGGRARRRAAPSTAQSTAQSTGAERDAEHGALLGASAALLHCCEMRMARRTSEPEPRRHRTSCSVHGSTFEQPILESLLRPCAARRAAPESRRSCPARPPQLRTLMQRFSAACCPRSCARSRKASTACAARAAAYANAAHTLTQRTRSRSSAHAAVQWRPLLASPDQMSPRRAPRSTGSLYPFSTFYLTRNQHLSILHLTRFACA